jgi:sugar lactone lactonase YvrE
MTRSLPFALAALPLFVVACGGEPPATPPAPSAAPSAVPPPADTPPAPSASASSDPVPSTPPAPTSPPPAAKYTGLDTPESVLYDDANDRYLVSNINGKPLDIDNNGYIAVLSPDGTITTQKWISGAQNKVKLDAPKGMAIAKGVLYVADITVVRMFDAKSGAPKGDVKIPGSTFLNDVAASADGSKIYVSDSGLKLSDKGFAPTGTDAVWIIENRSAKPLAKSTDLGAPNGLLPVPTGVWVVTFGSGELYRLDAKGAKQDAMKLPKGILDGIVAVGDSMLVSSWEGSEIFRGKPGGTFDVAIPAQKAPADIGYDTKRGRVLVPHFMDGTVEAYDLK